MRQSTADGTTGTTGATGTNSTTGTTGQPVQPVQPVQTAQLQGFSYAPAPKKKNRGLLIGLISGCVVLTAGIVVLILFLTGVIGGKSLPGVYQPIRYRMGVMDEYDYIDASFDFAYLEIFSNGLGDVHEYDNYLYDATAQNALYWDDNYITVYGERFTYECNGNTLTLTSLEKDLVLEYLRVDKRDVRQSELWPR